MLCLLGIISALTFKYFDRSSLQKSHSRVRNTQTSNGLNALSHDQKHKRTQYKHYELHKPFQNDTNYKKSNEESWDCSLQRTQLHYDYMHLTRPMHLASFCLVSMLKQTVAVLPELVSTANGFKRWAWSESTSEVLPWFGRSADA